MRFTKAEQAKLEQWQDRLATIKGEQVAQTLFDESRTVAIAWPDGWYWEARNPTELKAGEIYEVD